MRTEDRQGDLARPNALRAGGWAYALAADPLKHMAAGVDMFVKGLSCIVGGGGGGGWWWVTTNFNVNSRQGFRL